ncbi:MAG: alpha/beta fold hydrolase [Chloroflexi bacterium]|nr:alpha/beta fold hydrolase [Chloroflexota bacterium]
MVNDDDLPRHFVDALGIKTAYYTAGEPNGRPLVCLHGMTASGDAFRELMAGLAEEHWLIAPDIPGFGESEATSPYVLPHLVEWLAAFHDALDLPPMALAGHSFGGALAAAYTLAYPEDVTGLLLFAPALLTAQYYPDFVKKVGLSLGLADLSTAVSQSPRVVRRVAKASFYAPENIDETVIERRVRAYEQARASADVLKALSFYNFQPELKRLEKPVCLVWGEQDTVVRPDDGETLLTLLPQAELHLIPECGHIPLQEKPAECVAIARQWLRG